MAHPLLDDYREPFTRSRFIVGGSILIGALILLSIVSTLVNLEPSRSDPVATFHENRVAVFLGDSYSAGSGVTRDNRFTTLIAKTQGWKEINLANGGTGYLRSVDQPAEARNACGQDRCPSYTEMIDRAAAAAPDIVVVGGGRNDLTQVGTLRWMAGVRAFYVSLREALPESTIIATSPIWDERRVPADLNTMRTLVQQAVTDVGGIYVDLGDPLLGQPKLMQPDGIHPDIDGHQAIAAAFDAGLDRTHE